MNRLTLGCNDIIYTTQINSDITQKELADVILNQANKFEFTKDCIDITFKLNDIYASVKASLPYLNENSCDCAKRLLLPIYSAKKAIDKQKYKLSQYHVKWN